MLSKQKRKTVILTMVLILFISVVYSQPLSSTLTQRVHGETTDEIEEAIEEITSDEEQYVRKDLYSNYIEEYGEFPRPENEIIVEGENYTSVEDMDVEVVEDYEGLDGSALITDEVGSVTWEVDVPEEGLYNVNINYFPIEGKSSAIEREFWINDQLPFQGAATLSFPRAWTNELENIKQDNRENDLRPKQVEDPLWMQLDLHDSDGYYTDPYQFYFKKGKNEITFVSSREPLAIDFIKLYQIPAVPSYKELKESYAEQGYIETEDIFIKVQGEDAHLKSAPTLYPINDRTSPATEPYDVSKIRMNAIGGYNWRWPGQWISWKVEVPEDGLYEIGVKHQQNMLRGVFSTRKLLINGETPFLESENVAFHYNDSWDIKKIGEEEEEDPYLYYLTKGTNEISLEVTLGDIAPLLRTVEESVLELNHIYRKILMVTGAVPDQFRDYELEKNIPEMLEVFERQSDIIHEVAKQLENVTGETSDQTAILNTMAYQLDDFVKRPETIQKRLDTYKINVGGLGTWVLTVREQPLEIDYLVVASPDQKMPKADANMFEKVKHELGGFFYSFIEDYNTIGNVADDVGDEQNITVWIGAGRDQAQVLKAMIDETFTPETNINVNLNLVDMEVLLPATLARQGPDVAMGIGNDVPVNYAMRNAVADLTKFPDYSEIETRFRESAVLPFRFNDGVYGLPEQQLFSMLFYRKDIFDELNLKVPETWEELYALIPELQKSHMDVGLPIEQEGAGQNLIPNETFTMMLYQNDGQLYENNDTKSGLDSEASMEVFKEWSQLYTNYKLPLAFDFPNRFRTGEIPIGIVDYSFYNHLSVSAPEIRGLWEFVPVPGTLQEDGEIRREVGSSGTSTIIMERSDNKDASWEFLKWWTSKDVQVRFGREMEGLMGAAARYPTANVDALRELPWPVKDYEQLEKQWKWVRGVPQVPGGYFTGRHLDNAFREVINDGTNPREALNDYIIYINDEIKVKRKEFNLPLE